MKKAYEAPQIMFEDFTLSASIAGDCDTLANGPTLDLCGYKYTDRTGNDIKIFLESVGGCEHKIQDGAFNELCYHNPTQYTNLFNS